MGEQGRKDWWSKGEEFYEGTCVIGSTFGDHDDYDGLGASTEGTDAAKQIVAEHNRLLVLEARVAELEVGEALKQARAEAPDPILFGQAALLIVKMWQRAERAEARVLEFSVALQDVVEAGDDILSNMDYDGLYYHLAQARIRKLRGMVAQARAALPKEEAKNG